MRIAPLFVALLFVAACSGGAPLATEKPLPMDATERDLVRALTLNGFSVETGVYRRPPLLEGPGRELRVRSPGAGTAFGYAGTLHVHEYDTPEEADEALDDMDATFGTVQPHVYRRGQMVVVYFGTGTDLPDTLGHLFAPPKPEPTEPDA
jgi:hypothetical protein